MKRDYITHLYTVRENTSSLMKTKTEYELAKDLESLRRENKNVCEFCNSQNVEVLNVEVDDYLLFDYDRLKEECIKDGVFIISINIDKKDGKKMIKFDGEYDYDTEFILKTIQKSTNEINIIPEINFIQHAFGNFYICLVGNSNECKIESLRYSGFEKNEIIEGLEKVFIRYGI